MNAPVEGALVNGRAARVWVLNLDVEHELETRGSYTPSRAMRALVSRQSARLSGSLVRPGDVVLTGRETGAERAVLAGRAGLAWSPTPRALAMLEGVGARTPAAPPIEALRRVNARPFAVEVRRPLAGASFEKQVAHDLDRALELLARPAARGWLARRSFGAAGRGRLRLEAGRPMPAELDWLAASLRLGPLVVEPWVEVVREHTRSGWVEPGGRVTIAPPCFQETSPSGAWLRTETAHPGEVACEDDDALARAVETAGRALAAAGYFGPFGIDAFRHRDPLRPTRTVLNPLSEINARFTMDWATGMGTRTPHR